MRIAFLGKGGSGKTTAAALFARLLEHDALPVWAFDADINQQLGAALGFSSAELGAVPALADRISTIKEYLRGTNPRIASAGEMLKTTPPGAGSRLVGIEDELLASLSLRRGALQLFQTGVFNDGDIGTHCYHAKTGAVEVVLNHLIDRPKEYVVVDMTAGTDAFASGMFTAFDLSLVVVEPTIRSVEVFVNYRAYAAQYGLLVRALGNKVQSARDIEFLESRLGNDLIATLRHSSYIREIDQGTVADIGLLEAENLRALHEVRTFVDALPLRHAERFSHMIEFHQRNCRDWANALYGKDLTAQIDPEFSLVEPNAREQITTMKEGDRLCHSM